MEQDSGENGTKENQKPSVTPKPGNGRAGNSLGPGMAMKIPKQPTKTTAVPKKVRQAKSPKDGAPDIPNVGNVQTRSTREGRRAIKDEKPRLSPPLNQRQSKDLNGSRHSSASPIRRKDSGDASDDRAMAEEEPKLEQPVDVNDIEASSESLKQLLSIGGGVSSRIVYSRIQLLNISENPSSKNRPDCLEIDFNATNGRWDPETWHRSLSSPPPTPTSVDKSSKFPLPENRDRFTEDAASSGIILGPQRRSFQDGCHVTSSSRSSSKPHMSSTAETSRHTRPRLIIRQRSEIATDYEGPPAGRERQIESASALRTEEFDWDRRDGKSRYGERDLSDLRPEPRRPRDLPKNLQELRSGNVRDRDNEREYKDFRDRDYRERKFSHSREYGNDRGGWYQSQPRERRERRFSNNEPEPEWYTDGPTSQSDTIDLAGFAEETPVAASDFSSWGGGIPMDGIEDPGEDQKEGIEEGEKESENEGENQDALEQGIAETVDNDQSKADDTQTSGSNMEDGTEVEIPEFGAVTDEILKENTTHTTNGASDESLTPGGLSSRFSQWFQRENILQKESGSGVSTPHEELENIAALTAEQGLGSPADLDGKQQMPGKADIMRYLAQMKASSGNLSQSLKPDSAEQQEILRQQMKLGSVMTAADIEAGVGARHSPSQSYGGVDMQNTDAFNKLVASIREKDKIRQQQQLFAQQALLQGKSPADLMSGLTIGRTPSPDDPSTHNVLQQSLIKKQLEMQKVAYKEKVRLMEQQRREEQLREAIRTADAKMFESKQMNKSLSFMPTSVMRKMQESRDGKMPGDEMHRGPLTPGEADDIATATASFSAKLANSGKRLPTPPDQMPHQTNDLLARIYQSASQAKRQNSSSGLRRNASYPEVLMDANKLNRSSAFHQPSRQNMGVHDLNVRGDVDATRLRLHEMQNAGLLSRQHSKSGNLVADAYNNNLKYDRSSPRSRNDLSDKTPDAEMELKNQHEVAVLTQSVLKQFGITEDQLSRLTPQEQHSVVQVIQRRYMEMQAHKQMLSKNPSTNPLHGMKLHEAKTDLQIPGVGKQVKLEDPALLKPVNTIPPNSLGFKFAPQPAPGIPGVTAPGPIPGLLSTSNPQLHPYQLRVAQPLPFIQPMTRAPVVPATFLPQTHIPGRILPSNVPLASPIANQAAALVQMQLLQQQQQRFYAAAFQQQQLQALAAARQKDSREFNNPLERWFGRDALSQSQLPPHKHPMHLADVERVNHPNKE